MLSKSWRVQTTFNYTIEGKVAKEEIYADGVNKSNEFLYAYDKLGRLESLTEKDGNDTEIARIKASVGQQSMYTETDQLKEFDLTYRGQTDKIIPYRFSYLPNGLVSTVKGASKEFKFFFTEGSQLASKENPNTTSDEFAYNVAGQLMESKTNRVNKTVTATANGDQIVTKVDSQWSSRYEYDKDGRIKEIIGQGAGSPSAKYTYNQGSEKLNRLTQAVITEETQTGPKDYTFNYAYDAMGNLLEMDVVNGGVIEKQTFSYDNDNRITNLGFEYDNRQPGSGNLTKADVKGQTYNYEYDKANRLTKVRDAAGNEIASYTYDAQGQRLTKKVGNDIITYHYFNGDCRFLSYLSEEFQKSVSVGSRHF